MEETADTHFQLIQLNKVHKNSSHIHFIKFIFFKKNSFCHLWFKKCYAVWQYKFRTGKDERHSERLALNHYKSNLLDKCLQSLRYYAIYRRKKKKQKQKLNEYAESQLVYKIYHMWLSKFEKKKQSVEVDRQVTQFRDRFTMARSLEYWKNGNIPLSLFLNVKHMVSTKN